MTGTPQHLDLSTDLAGLPLSSPVILASGTAMYGQEVSNFIKLADIGAIITKSVLARPWSGLPPSRAAATPSGMLNGIGLQGEGIETLLERHLPWLAEQDATVIVSLAGHTTAEYARSAELIARHREPVHTVEINISCPNVESQDRVFARHPDSASRVVAAVRDVLPDVRIAAKLSPDVADIVEIARACVDAGADVISLINTVTGAAINPRTLGPTLSNTFGGLSGPAIKPIAVRCIWQVHEALPQIPILGGGGVRSGQDALDLTVAGASAIAIGTVNFEEPDAAVRIASELHRLLAAHGIARYRDAIGIAHRTSEPK
ncbi:dihydroorotate dehydrogenase [Streptomyces sp. DW26H14]|uniref:dihydroorotate dehydrogenase n=1 Tax=Streptomyces sp. DW26H14 TaxID=3435395 RepID=UPI00403DCDFE